MPAIVQIVPHLPPTVSGVGDYALLLAQELRRSHGIHTRFVVCDPDGEGIGGKAESRKQKAAIELDGFTVFRLGRRSAADLCQLLSAPGMPATVLLQYVGYGYQKRGCPLWLVRGLERWRRQKTDGNGTTAQRRKTELSNPGVAGTAAGVAAEIPDASHAAPGWPGRCRLVTMFHELYAWGPPWTSAFWTSSLQKSLVRRLALSSTRSVTNLVLSARALSRLARRSAKSFVVLPVFSNVGEPRVLPPIAHRPKRLVVFGSAGWRELVYRQHRGALEQACRQLGLGLIVDIGPPMRPPAATSILWEQKGPLPAAKVSEELLACRAGFFACPVHCLAKSGIFAAYAAHGLVPVTIPGVDAGNLDGLRAGEHFVRADSSVLADADHCDRIARSVSRWYAGHCLSAQAVAFAEAIDAAGA